MSAFTIYTRKNPATDTTGESITAVAVNDFDGSKRQLTRPYNYALGVAENHDAVANELDVKLTRESVLFEMQGHDQSAIGAELAACARFYQKSHELTQSGRGYRYNVASIADKSLGGF